MLRKNLHETDCTQCIMHFWKGKSKSTEITKHTSSPHHLSLFLSFSCKMTTRDTKTQKTNQKQNNHSHLGVAFGDIGWVIPSNVDGDTAWYSSFFRMPCTLGDCRCVMIQETLMDAVEVPLCARVYE